MQKQKKDFILSGNFLTFTTRKAVVFIVIIGLLVFFNMLNNGFVWDDKNYIIFNQDIRTISNISLFEENSFNNAGQYRALGAIYFAILYTFSGITPFLYHFLQLALHITNSVLVLILFRKFFGPILSLFLSLVFLVHPIQVESVSFIAASVNPLFFLFGILSLLLLSKKEIRKKTTYTILAFVPLMLALLTKDTGAVFILILLLCPFVFKWKEKIKIISGLLITFFIYVAVRIATFGEIFPNTENLAGIVPIANLSFSQRLINIPAIFTYYLKTFIFPNILVIDQQWVITSVNFQEFYLPLIVSVLFLLLCIFLFFRFRNKDNKKFAAFTFFALWFFIGISVHLQIIPLNMTVADRWFYFPMVGFLGILGTIIDSFNISTKKLNFQKLAIPLAILIVLLLSLRTIARNSKWRDEITLYTTDSRIYENESIENNLAVEYMRIKQYDEALKHFKRSVEILPTELNMSNLGYYYFIFGDYQKTERYYKKGLSLNKYPLKQHRKVQEKLIVRLTLLYLSLNEYEKARDFLKQDLMGFPKNGHLWKYLAVSEYRLGNKEEALVDILIAKQFLPGKEMENIYTQIKNNREVYLPELEVAIIDNNE